MSRRVNESLPMEWRKRLREQASSGLTVADFCRREKVSVANYYKWKQKLCDNDKEAFVARRDRAAFVQLPPVAVNSPAIVEIVIANGTVIRVAAERSVAIATAIRAVVGPTQEDTPHA